MQIRHTYLLGAGAAIGAMATPASAQTVNVSITVPRMTVAEYHRPYVAIWLEKEGAPPRTLAVWYDIKKAKGEGTKWLRDVRQWWRVSGRTMTFPADGVTGATRAPGEQKIAFTAGKGPLGAIGPGNYTLVVEAAREVGGREVVSIPFQWPPTAAAQPTAAGKEELGEIKLELKP